MSDANPELITAYRQVQSNVEAIIQRLSQRVISPKAFYRSRSARPRWALDRAVRLLYLNRTAFNGMYRVNKEGEFNVPFGCKPSTILCNRIVLRQASAALRGAALRAADFEPQIDQAGEGDVVFCDPPFTVKHDNNGFIRYNESLFSWDDQIRLATACLAAAQRGVRVIISNAHRAPVRELYPGFAARLVTRKSLVSAAMSGRGPVSEYVLLSRN